MTLLFQVINDFGLFRDCFLSSVTHKFRACLGKSRVMRPGDRVLVGFSGGDRSAALLHLIQSGLADTSHKRLMIEPLVLFIDGRSIRVDAGNRV